MENEEWENGEGRWAAVCPHAIALRLLCVCAREPYATLIVVIFVHFVAKNKRGIVVFFEAA